MNPKDLAAAYGLRTGDEIGAPAARAPRPNPEDVRWTRERKMVFAIVRPLSLCFVTQDGPMSVTTMTAGGDVIARLGHNRAVWPAKIVPSRARTDSVTTQYDRDPFVARGTRFRVWTLNERAHERLLEGVLELIAVRSEMDGGMHELRSGFKDLGPDLDLDWFETEIHDLARRLEIRAWSTPGLVAWFDVIFKEAQRIAAAHGRAPSARLIEKLIYK